MPLAEIVVALLVVGVIAWIVNTRVAMEGSVRNILNVVLLLIVVGAGLWLINTYVPMAGSIKTILNIVVVIATCVRVLQAFHLWGDAVRMWHNLTSHRS